LLVPLSSSVEASVLSCHSQSEESSFAVLLGVSDGSEFEFVCFLDDWHHDASLVLFGSLARFFGGVSLLAASLVFGEEDQFRFELFQTIGVHFQRLFGQIGASCIDSNADGSRLCPVDAGSLQFLKSEATTQSLFHVVFTGGGSNDWPEEPRNGSWKNASGLSGSGNSAALLLSCLVEPSFDKTLPSLAEMDLLDLIVMFHP